MPVKPIPDNYNTISVYLIVDGAEKLITFMTQAFGGSVIEKMQGPDGRIAHAEVRIGNSVVMLSEARPEWPAQPTMLYIYVNDTDSTFSKAMAAGGISIMEPADQFYGDRNGLVKDMCGNQWCIATHVEDVSPEEMRRRAAEKNKGS